MKKNTNKQKVIAMLADGMKAPEISGKLGISLQSVYCIKSDAKKQKELLCRIKFIGEEKVDRPKKTITRKTIFQKVKSFFGA